MNKLLSYFPRKLPVGMADFNTWSDRIIDLSGKFADPDSMKFALATMIMHLGPQDIYKADEYFVRSLRKVAANQVAGQIFSDIKEKQAKRAAEAAAKAAEETAQQAEAPATSGANEEQRL